MQKKIVKFYRDDKGKAPFLNWLKHIKDRGVKLKIRNRIRRIALGSFGDYKYIGNGIFELRIYSGPGYRIYFGQIQNVVIILLCGGDKSSQKHDIVKANKYWNDFKK